ncbi:MAG: hypothetical protein GEU95_01180 [Rhizobiales bacterium]|nr:hypothetical protein [Hyphomicrobiales bacterium]
MKAAIDLTRYHARAQHGDITAYLTWWLADDGGPRPCIVLIPTRMHERVQPCVVHIEQAWMWSEEIGDPERACRLAFAFAAALGLDVNNQMNVFRVRSIIVDHLGDLLTMPPMPDDMRESVVIGEAKVTNREAGTVVRHEEITDRV